MLFISGDETDIGGIRSHLIKNVVTLDEMFNLTACSRTVLHAMTDLHTVFSVFGHLICRELRPTTFYARFLLPTCHHEMSMDEKKNRKNKDTVY